MTNTEIAANASEYKNEFKNPRQIIPSERFLERIWGYESDVELGVVWAYISYLRKKLTALHADIQIRAARNVGYSLEAVS